MKKSWADASMASFFVVSTEADMNQCDTNIPYFEKQLKDDKQEGKITIYEYRT
ncbi:hypothetical protein [Paenibacillus sp. 7516]|uniref:hypothetical protein n=1 Tax=Paenibacillus sp. 7516 TaxID=2022549 RepID=UPI001483B864|nr:hypothetical protein [Paenibacillus sp. 7516]